MRLNALLLSTAVFLSLAHATATARDCEEKRADAMGDFVHAMERNVEERRVGFLVSAPRSKRKRRLKGLESEVYTLHYMYSNESSRRIALCCATVATAKRNEPG